MHGRRAAYVENAAGGVCLGDERTAPAWCDVFFRQSLLEDLAVLDHLERVAGHALQLIEIIVVPAGVLLAAEVPVTAVVGEEHAVLLHGGEDDLGRPGEAAGVEAGLEAHPGAE